MQSTYSGPLENVSAGLFTLSEAQSIVFIARDQNYFAKNGINLTAKPISTSLLQINATLNNDVDIGTSADFSFVSNVAMQEKDLTILASLARVQSYAITVRKDKGIENPVDLAGKRIGLSIQSTSEYYLSRFLEAKGLNRRNVTLINVPPAEFERSIVNGTVDAIVSGTRAVHNQVQTQLGSNVITWPAQGIYSTHLFLVARSDWVVQHQKTVERFLKALSMAEDYIINNPDSAKAIVERYLNRTVTQETWSDYRFSLSLDQSLITTLQNEARWLIDSNLTNATQIPDFLNYVYMDGLKSVKPESVNIIG